MAKQQSEGGVPVNVPTRLPYPDGVPVKVPTTTDSPESTDSRTTKNGQKAATKEK